MRPISSWGRLSTDLHDVVTLADSTQTENILRSHQPGIAYGMGRSYGDACLNANGKLWRTSKLDHFLHFDRETGLLTCEAGVLLQDIQQLAIKHGWALPVTPGTQRVTVGGAIANDVHGKNHHVYGSFSDHVTEMSLVRTDGEQIRCGPDNALPWFTATSGGLGLTGLISQASIQLRPVKSPWLTVETRPYSSLEEFSQLAEQSTTDWEYTVSWIDCLSAGNNRGLFMRANHNDNNNQPVPSHRPRGIPFTPPFSLVNTMSLRLFNGLYYHVGKKRSGLTEQHYESFFYPLDNLQHWNRIYGPDGFYQYQCVIPYDQGLPAIKEVLREIARSKQGSFLAVLKNFGKRQAKGLLSFPQPGITLALDFPNRQVKTTTLFERLDAIVCEAGGRLYAAKDARMPRWVFEKGYPRLEEFLAFRDPGISSEMSRRLMGS